MSEADTIAVDDLYTEPSPSAIALGDMCEARQGARYIARLKEPEGAKASLGTRCHAISAEYLRDGTPPNRAETFEISMHGTPRTFYPGRIVRGILQHLPPAGSVPDVERPISLTWRGIKFNTRSAMDWATGDRYGDHKFTTAVKYAKSAKELIEDAQRVIYAADWFQWHDADEVIGQWTYGQFDCRGSSVVLVPATRAEIAKLMDDVIVPKAERLLDRVRRGVDWNTLPKNTNACSKFPPDGCPYASKCTRSLKERIAGVMASSLLEKFKAKKAAAAAQAAAPTSPSVDKAEVPPSDDIENDADEAAQHIVGAINPPGEAADAPVDAPSETPAATPKRGRGRPKKDAPKPIVPENCDPAGQDSWEKPAEAEPVAAAETSEQPAPTSEKKLVLLVDCVALRGMNDVTHASDLIEQAHAHIRKAYEVLDYRAGGHPEIDFGKGAGVLTACVAGLIEDLPQDTVVVLDTKSLEGQLALQTFMSAAHTILRGAA